MPQELFELSMLGGAEERQYRRLRPEVEKLPWGTIDRRRYSDELIESARRSWTLAAFQEHRTAAACTATLEALITARAPVDLIAVATRFPLDEMVHVEMCARLAEELGGATPLMHDPDQLVPHPPRSLSPRLRAAELVVRVFCVGEAVSIPLLRGTARAARHPLMRAVLQRIVKDEAAHGRFGFVFLDWILDELSGDERHHLRAAATDEMAKLERLWSQITPRSGDEEAHPLGWMKSTDYLALAHRALEDEVRGPLAARDLA